MNITNPDRLRRALPDDPVAIHRHSEGDYTTSASRAWAEELRKIDMQQERPAQHQLRQHYREGRILRRVGWLLGVMSAAFMVWLGLAVLG